MKEQILKKGDLIYEHINGWGRICEQVNPEDDCVAVNFAKLFIVAIVDKRKVSFTQYDLIDGGFSQERPKPELKNGEMVWVRDYDYKEWGIRYFKILPNGRTTFDDWKEYSILNPYPDSIEARLINILRELVSDAPMFSGVHYLIIITDILEEIDSYEK